MKLGCVIITYKEPYRELKRTLDSIAAQVSFEFSGLDVVVSNDCGGVVYNIPGYPFKVRQTTTKQNGGCGVNRQSGIDILNADYVFFMDCGDILAANYVLATINAVLEKKRPTVLTTTFLEQRNDNALIEKKGELSWVHGKWYNVQALKEHGIRFADDIRTQEDSYFNTLITGISNATFETVPLISYIWLWDENSITRRNNCEYSFNDFENYIQVIGRAIDRIPSKAAAVAYGKLLSYCYAIFHYKAWRKRAEPYFADITAALKREIDQHHWLYAYLDKTERATILEGHTRCYPQAEYNETFKEWFNGL